MSINRICSDNPSPFSEGRFFEVYSISEDDIDRIVKSIIKPSLNENTHSEYSQYKEPIWKPTPVYRNDSILQFIHTQMEEEKNECFDESIIKTVLFEEGNFFLPLYDNLGRIRLFLLETKTGKLFLLTSYIL